MTVNLPINIIQEIQLLKEYLDLVDGNFISERLCVSVSRGWVTYRDPDNDWYHVTYYAQIQHSQFDISLPRIADGYLNDFLESYTEEYREDLSDLQSERLLKQKEIEWKLRIISDYSREEHIKRLIWALADKNDESLRISIENNAQIILSPDRIINFNEFHADGMCFEIVSHNTPRVTSADFRDVKLKAIDGLFGGYPNYGNRRPCLPNKKFLRIPYKIYKFGLGNCRIVGLAAGVFDNMGDVEVLELPNTLRQVEWSLWQCRKLKEIRINNSYDINGFKSIDGVLFSGDKKKLIAYPNNHGEEYEVPEGTEIIASKAFKDCFNLKRLILPSSLKTIGLNAFYRCESLKLIQVNGPEDTLYCEGLFGNYGNVNPKWEYSCLP